LSSSSQFEFPPPVRAVFFVVVRLDIPTYNNPALRIDYLQLRDIRNIAYCEIEPAPGLNYIYGSNAQGKTNLIEAIHFLATLDIHRGQTSDFIRNDAERGNIAANVEVDDLHRRIEITVEKRRSAIVVDGDAVRRSRDYLGRVLSVAFFPEDMLILLMEPALRRRWLDKFLGTYHLPYRETVSDAKKALESRNSLLREPMRPEPTLFDSIESVLAPLAAKIMVGRREIIGVLTEELARIYSDDFAGSGTPSLEYKPSFKPAEAGNTEVLAEAYRQALKEGRERDIAVTSTLVGPHRDDFILSIDSQPVRTFASRGEVRTALFSLNIAKLSILREKYGNDPIVLLDDVLSELDFDRRRMVISALPKGSQIFITSTEKDDEIISLNSGSAVWYVENGKVEKV
jgi:DNA replication and repair protein RecF